MKALRDRNGRFVSTTGNPAYERLKTAIFALDLSTDQGRTKADTLLKFGAELLGVA